MSFSALPGSDGGRGVTRLESCGLRVRLEGVLCKVLSFETRVTKGSRLLYGILELL